MCLGCHLEMGLTDRKQRKLPYCDRCMGMMQAKYLAATADISHFPRREQETRAERYRMMPEPRFARHQWVSLGDHLFNSGK